MKRISQQKISQWFFGILFILISLSSFSTSPISAIAFLLLAVVLIPTFSEFLSKKIKIPYLRQIKYFSLVVLTLAALYFNRSIAADKNLNIALNPIPTINPTPSLEQPTPATGSAVSQNKEYYSIKKIVDGDTISLIIDGRSQNVRFIGINSPESVDPRKPVECFGKESSQKLKDLIGDNKVAIEADSSQGDKDKYGRLLRYVYLPDGTNLNWEMISQGYAFEYTYDLPYRMRDDFISTQKQARENKRGLWAENACPLATPTPLK